jgi:hypothetical protein
MRLENGKLNFSLVSQFQHAIKKEESRTGEKVGSKDKLSLLKSMENLTANAAQKLIKERFPDIRLGEDTIRRLNSKESKLNAVIDNLCVDNLHRSKEILSHIAPEGSWGEVLGFLADFFIAERDPLSKMTHPVTKLVNPRVITPTLRAQIIQRAGGQCEFRDEISQRRCESRYQLEIDHIHPRALGGDNSPENLRVLCRAHNQHEAERILGTKFSRKRESHAKDSVSG